MLRPRRHIFLWLLPLLLPAAAVLALNSVGDDAWLGFLRGLERDPTQSMFDSDTASAIRARALTLAALALALWVGFVALRPGPATPPADAAPQSAATGNRRMLRLCRVAVLLGTAGSGIALAWHLDGGLRQDEARSAVNYALRHPAVTAALYDNANNHVAANLLAGASLRVFGLERWALRLPTFLCALLTAPLLFEVVRRAMPRRHVRAAPVLAAAAALLWTASPVFAELATNARGYALGLAAWLTMLVLLPRALEPAGRWAQAGIVVTSAVALWAVPILLLAVFPTWLALGCGLLRQGRRGLRRGLGMTMALTLIGLVLYGPAWIVLGTEAFGGAEVVRLDDAFVGVRERRSRNAARFALDSFDTATFNTGASNALRGVWLLGCLAGAARLTARDVPVHARLLVLCLPPGMLLLWAASGYSAIPSWSLSPLAVLPPALVCVAVAPLIGRLLTRPQRAAAFTVSALAGTLVLTTLQPHPLIATPPASQGVKQRLDAAAVKLAGPGGPAWLVLPFNPLQIKAAEFELLRRRRDPSSPLHRLDVRQMDPPPPSPPGET